MVSSVGSSGSGYGEYASRAIDQANQMLETALKKNVDQSVKFLKFSVTTGEKIPAGDKGSGIDTYA